MTTLRNLAAAAALALATAATPAFANELAVLDDADAARAQPLVIASATAAEEPVAALDRMSEVLDRALGLIGIRYKRGASSVENGFDCSGLVAYVFRSVLGHELPRTTYEIARLGAAVSKGELKPGDLVFFNTMRRSFSHVGIYLGDQKFLHAPRTGLRVRIEDMTGPYWAARFNGARRLAPQ